MSHEENKHDIGKYSSFNSENLKNSFNTQPERKIVLNTETINEHSELCNQCDDSLDNTFSREIEVEIEQEESNDNVVEFNAEEFKSLSCANEGSSKFNSNPNNVKPTEVLDDMKSLKDYKISQKYQQDSTKIQNIIQKYCTVGECEKPQSLEKISTNKQSEDLEDLVYSNSTIKNAKEKKNNVIIESYENNNFRIYASETSFVSIKTIDNKDVVNVQNFECKYEDTEATNFSKSVKLESKFCSPLQFSSEFLREKSCESLDKFNYSAVRHRYTNNIDKPTEELKFLNSIPFRIEGSKGNSADVVYQQSKEAKSLRSFESCPQPILRK